MLDLALQHVADALASYVEVRTGADDAVVASALVEPGKADGIDNAAKGKLALTLVRLEEDRLSRRPEFHERISADQVRRVEPPTILSAYVLVAATHTTYAEALKAVGHAVAFFQNTRSVDYAAIDGVEAEGRLLIEMESPSFEELNHLWGTVGVKYLPSVLYRVRLVQVDDAQPAAIEPAVGTLAVGAEGLGP